MSRLENHAMLRDSATDVFNSQCALLEKYGLAVIERVFYRGKLIFQVIVHMKDKSIIGLFICFCTTPKGRKWRINFAW